MVTPLQAGRYGKYDPESPLVMDRREFDEHVSRIAQEAAQAVVQELRTSQKKGRSDRGSGSEGVGNSLREVRLGNDLSLRELGELSGVHPTTISKIERGERGMSLHTFARLARVLGMTWAEWVITEVRQWSRD